MSAAADQVGQALAQDQLAAEARAADVARQSDALKSALLQSVSHDLRTPLATIRAAAGTLRPDSDLDAAGRPASAAAIEREVERLDRLVANLLDLGRIEAGALRADLDVFELDDLAGRDDRPPRAAPRGHDLRLDARRRCRSSSIRSSSTRRSRTSSTTRSSSPAPGSTIRVAAEQQRRRARAPRRRGRRPGRAGRAARPRLREVLPGAPGGREAARAGTGIGLAVVRGLVVAMGGAVRRVAATSAGSPIELELPPAAEPAGSSWRRRDPR